MQQLLLKKKYIYIKCSYYYYIYIYYNIYGVQLLLYSEGVKREEFCLDVQKTLINAFICVGYEIIPL